MVIDVVGKKESHFSLEPLISFVKKNAVLFLTIFIICSVVIVCLIGYQYCLVMAGKKTLIDMCYINRDTIIEKRIKCKNKIECQTYEFLLKNQYQCEKLSETLMCAEKPCLIKLESIVR